MEFSQKTGALIVGRKQMPVSNGLWHVARDMRR